MPQVPKWGLYVDRALNDGGSRADWTLISPDGHRIHCALKFIFKASNNEAEYEALIAGLKLAKEMKVESLEIFSDSQIIVRHINDEYQALRRKNGSRPLKSQGIARILRLVYDQSNLEVIERGSRCSRSTGLDERHQSAKGRSSRNL